jgi:hypothetical protein
VLDLSRKHLHPVPQAYQGEGKLAVLHSRKLPRVLAKLRDGRHVGSGLMECAEWQHISKKAAEWQTLHDEDATRMSWEDVFLDLANTYEHHMKSYSGDPTGLAT